MSKLVNRLWISIIGLSFFCPQVEAQDCTKNIEMATAMYKRGQITEMVDQVIHCTESSDPAIQWNAYRLMALVYLANNQPDSARFAARQMMKLNTTYKPSSLKDPIELVKLLSSIPVIPKVSLGFAMSFGTNSTLIAIDKVYMVSEQTKDYKGLKSLQFGVSSKYQVNRSLAIDMTFMASTKKYEMDYSFGNWGMQMNESLTYLMLPVQLMYSPKLKWRLKPYAQFGGYGGYLLFSDNNFYANYKPGNESYALLNLSSRDRRNLWDYGLVGGVGINYLVGPGQAFFNASYFKSFSSVVKNSERYTNKQLTYSHFYVDDDFKLSNMSVSVGYSLFINYKVLKD